eukprot:m51a1_g153 hypothetical protein (1344) ;mRNA; r:490804-501369
MAAILERALRSYLAAFVKTTGDRQLDMSLLRGEINLSNIELNEKNMHALWKFPPTLEIKRISCGTLRMRVPWRNLSKEPIAVALANVTVVIGETREPVDSVPDPVIERMLAPKEPTKSTAKKKRGFVDALLEDAQVEVSNVRIQFNALQPEWASASAPVPAMTAELSTLTLRTTDSHWEVVELQRARAETRARGREAHVYKELRVGSLSIAMSADKDVAVPLLQLPPFAILAKRDAVTGAMMGVQATVGLQTLSLAWTRASWVSTISLVEAAMRSFDLAEKLKPTLDKLKTRGVPGMGGGGDDDDEDDEDGDSGDMSDKDLSNRELEQLAREIGAGWDSQSTASQRSSVESRASAQRVEKPVLHLDFEIDRAQAGWGGVAALDMRKLSVTVMMQRSDPPATASTSGMDIDDMPPAAPPFLTAFVRASIERLSMSVGTGGPYSEVMTPITEMTSRDPFLFATVAYKQDLEGPLGTPKKHTGIYDLDVAARLQGTRFAVEPGQAERLFDFFSAKRLVLPPSTATSDWSWLEGARGRIDISGLELRLRPNWTPDLPATAPHMVASIGSIDISVSSQDLFILVASQAIKGAASGSASASPPQSPMHRRARLSIYSGSMSVDQTSDAGSVVRSAGSSGVSAESSVLTLTINVRRIAAGYEVARETTYLLEPFDVETTLNIHKPQLVAACIDNIDNRLEDLALPSSTRHLPKVWGKIAVGSIVLNLVHSRGTVLYPTLEQHMKWINALKTTIENKDHLFGPHSILEQIAAAAKPGSKPTSPAASPSPPPVEDLGTKVAAAIRFRAEVELVVEKSSVRIAVPPASFLRAFECVERGVRESGEMRPDTMLRAVAALLFEQCESPELERELLSLSFSRVEATATHKPSMTGSYRPESHVVLVADVALRGMQLYLRPFPVLSMLAEVGPQVLDSSYAGSDVPDALACVVRANYTAVALGPQDAAAQRSAVQHQVALSFVGLRGNVQGAPSERFTALQNALEDKSKAAGRPCYVLSVDLSELDIKHMEDQWHTVALRVAPTKEGTTKQLREVYERRIESIQLRFQIESRESERRYQQSRQELSDVEAQLVESKLSEANALTTAGEKDLQSASLRHENERLTGALARLKAENERLYDLLRAKFKEVTIVEFKKIIESLSADVTASESKRSLMGAELERARLLAAEEQRRQEEKYEELKKASEKESVATHARIAELSESLRQTECQLATARDMIAEGNATVEAMRKKLEETEKRAYELQAVADQRAEMLAASLKRLDDEMRAGVQQKGGRSGNTPPPPSPLGSSMVVLPPRSPRVVASSSYAAIAAGEMPPPAALPRLRTVIGFNFRMTVEDLMPL